MKHISVTVDETHLPEIQHVADRLRSHGMQVDQVLETVGIITGSVSDEQYPALSTVRGIGSVDEQLRFQLPPPDDEVQ